MEPADIDSDLSAFHRIDAPEEVAGSRYFLLAERLAAYPGAVAARLAQNARAAQQVVPGSVETIPVQTEVARPASGEELAAVAAQTHGHGQGFPTIGYKGAKGGGDG